jgi:hypothetical protein
MDPLRASKYGYFAQKGGNPDTVVNISVDGAPLPGRSFVFPGKEGTLLVLSYPVCNLRGAFSVAIKALPFKYAGSSSSLMGAITRTFSVTKRERFVVNEDGALTGDILDNSLATTLSLKKREGGWENCPLGAHPSGGERGISLVLWRGLEYAEWSSRGTVDWEVARRGMVCVAYVDQLGNYESFVEFVRSNLGNLPSDTFAIGILVGNAAEALSERASTTSMRGVVIALKRETWIASGEGPGYSRLIHNRSFRRRAAAAMDMLLLINGQTRVARMFSADKIPVLSSEKG